MQDQEYLGYCGIYCELCSARTQIPERAGALMTSMRAADYEDFGPGLRDFEPFWRFLGELAQVGPETCCRTDGCGAPFCAIRKCARRREVTWCGECDDYPCDHVRTLARSEPAMLYDGQRLREIGMEAWLQEQQARKAAGFCYGDIRCGTGEVPREQKGGPKAD
jgi:hypothetical protein